MIEKIILISFVFMILGYLIGSVLSSVLVTKLLKLEDVRNKGSQNPGATNTVRQHGILIGMIVFFLDFCKPVIAAIITYFSVNHERVIIQLVLLSTVLGHIFPLFHKFKGGKGVSCMLGFLFIINWTIFLIAIFIFLMIVIFFKKMSLGSITIGPISLILYLSLSQIDGYNSITFEPLTYHSPYWINAIFLTMVVLIVILKHHQNIRRLINKNEHNYK